MGSHFPPSDQRFSSEMTWARSRNGLGDSRGCISSGEKDLISLLMLVDQVMSDYARWCGSMLDLDSARSSSNLETRLGHGFVCISSLLTVLKHPSLQDGGGTSGVDHRPTETTTHHHTGNWHAWTDYCSLLRTGINLKLVDMYPGPLGPRVVANT